MIERVGPYQLLHPLGAGGMAETFVAVRRGPAGFEQRVCLKRILPSRASDANFVELFLDEARLLARMSCRSIVQVYDFGEVQGTFYMALELVEGVDLEALLRAETAAGTRLPSEVAMYIAAELLSALSYTHDLKRDGEPMHIVHRDVSPSNILLSATGEVKLTDFGIAKARGRLHQTRVGHVKGKLAYMSPEQVRGEPLDARSDLFSAGIVLYQLFTAEHPFEAPSDHAVLSNIVQGKRKPIVELAPDLDPTLVSTVESMLATATYGRPASAADVIASISGLVPFVAGQRKLASRVSMHVESLLAHAKAPAPTTLAQSVYPPVGNGVTEGLIRAAMEPPDSKAQSAKSTTERRRLRSHVRVPAIVAGAGLVMGALFAAVWLRWGPEPEPSPLTSVPARLDSETKAGALPSAPVVAPRVEAVATPQPPAAPQPAQPPLAAAVDAGRPLVPALLRSPAKPLAASAARDAGRAPQVETPARSAKIQIEKDDF